MITVHFEFVFLCFTFYTISFIHTDNPQWPIQHHALSIQTIPPWPTQHHALSIQTIPPWPTQHHALSIQTIPNGPSNIMLCPYRQSPHGPPNIMLCPYRQSTLAHPTSYFEVSDAAILSCNSRRWSWEIVHHLDSPALSLLLELISLLIPVVQTEKDDDQGHEHTSNKSYTQAPQQNMKPRVLHGQVTSRQL